PSLRTLSLHDALPIFLASYEIQARDCMLIFSHGGLNAVPVEMAVTAREKGAKVVSVSSHENYRQAKATHSTKKKLPDVSDIAIEDRKSTRLNSSHQII